MKYSHILWDFNGTILDDVDTGIKSANTLLSRRGLNLLPDADCYRNVFCFPIIEYYRKLGFDFSRESFDDLAVEWVGEYLKNVKTAGLYPGVLETLKEIKRLGIYQAVLSATERSMLDAQLSDLGISELFNEVVGTDNIKACGKTDAGIEWARRTRPARALLIGDTDHDLHTARAMGADCILFSGGHQPRSALLDSGVPLIDDIRDVLSYIL